MGLIDLLFSKDGAYAAVGAAAIATIGWVAKGIIEWIGRIIEANKKKREHILRFYTDAVLRVENCSNLLNSGNQTRIKRLIAATENSSHKFRGYVTQVNDFSVYTNFQTILHSLGEYAIYHCSKYIVLDQLVVAQAERLESDRFADLPLERKLAVIDLYYGRMAELRNAGNAAPAAIEYLPGYARLREQYRNPAEVRSADQLGRA